MNQPENNSPFNDLQKGLDGVFGMMNNLLSELPEEQRKQFMEEAGPAVKKAQKDMVKLTEELKNLNTKA